MKRRTTIARALGGIARALAYVRRRPARKHFITTHFIPDPEPPEPEFATVERHEHTVTIRALDNSWELILPRAGHKIAEHLFPIIMNQRWPRLTSKQMAWIVMATKQ